MYMHKKERKKTDTCITGSDRHHLQLLLNIGVLMFTERPDKFIPGAQIDLVKFNTEEAEGSDDFLL